MTGVSWGLSGFFSSHFSNYIMIMHIIEQKPNKRKQRHNLITFEIVVRRYSWCK